MEGESSRSQGSQLVQPAGLNCQWSAEILVFIQDCHGTERYALPAWYP